MCLATREGTGHKRPAASGEAQRFVRHRRPVLLLHGRQDIFVPFGHGEWLAAHIPGVEARLLDYDGHLSLLQNRVPEVDGWLSDHS